MMSKYKEKVIEVLKNAEVPLSIDAVKFRAGIKTWTTAKSILLELLTQGRISGVKTSKSWIFWLPKDKKERT